jgi:hypothetical protein
MPHITRLIATAALIPFLAACSEQPAAHDQDSHAGHDHAEEPAGAGTSPVGSDAAPTPGGSSAETVSAAGLVFDIPEGWRSHPPSNSMRAAELVVETDAGPCTAAFSVARGGADANVTRWVGQFVNPEGDVLRSREDTTIAGRTVTIVEMAGEYRGMGMAPPEPDTIMRAAIVELGGAGQLFIKMTGPGAGMEPLAEGWNTLIASMRAE